MSESRFTAVLVPVQGCEWELVVSQADERGIIKLGRSEELGSNASVSRRHAELECCRNDWILRDAGSTNGTYLNGRPVDGLGQLIDSGDIVSLGLEVWFRFWPVGV